MFKLFHRKITVKEAAKALSDWNAMKDRQRIHARCDEIRERLGMPKVDWENLA